MRTASCGEVEASLSKRIGRVEHELEDHSGVIHELRSKSTATEDSVRSLLTAVENFCAQTTHQLEKMSPPLAIAPPQPVAASVAPGIRTDIRTDIRTSIDAGIHASIDAGIHADVRSGAGGRFRPGAEIHASFHADIPAGT